MVQRLLVLLTTVLLIENPGFCKEPVTDRNDPIEGNSLKEFDHSSETPVRPRGFARSGQARAAAYRPHVFENGPFEEGTFGENPAGREFRGVSKRNKSIVYETDFGFVFIDGQLVPPPYRVERRNGEYYINGISLSGSASSSEPPHGEDVPRLDVEVIYMQLNTDRIAVKFPERPILCLDEKADEKLLSIILLEPKARAAELDSFLAMLPSTENRAQWSAWVLQVAVTGTDLERLQQRMNFLNDTKDKSVKLLNAEAVMDSYSYPLTLIGMIVVVLAVGYLLAFNPTMAQLLPEQARAVQLSKSVQYSVILIVLMSALDLAWTILSSSVGLMNELNPVGSNLINDPASLVKFKMAATLLAAGLFIGLRKFRSAQLASWWMCIVCTLVSARWLVFNSLYMG